MANIIILSQDVIQKIAAGEVIERPASVVKELIENSIDSNAKRILIEIEEGGKKLIKVTDDGIGMLKEDVSICCERHATNKIKNEIDLNNIKTLGFRGEALSSISSVSKFEIITRNINSAEGARQGAEGPRKKDIGTLLKVEGGIRKEIHEIGAPIGTTISVKELFFNVPARLKFLKSINTETQRIIDCLFKYSLCYPQIEFQLIHRGKILFHEEITGHENRILMALGKELKNELIKLDYDDSLFKTFGMVSKPNCNRSERDMQFIFVNDRPITDRIINHAILEGYSTLIPKGRFPIYVIFFYFDPRLIDVNVHPTKREIRFPRSNEVHDKITMMISEILKEKMGDSIKISVYQPTSQKIISGEPSTITEVHEQKSIFATSPDIKILGQLHNTYILVEMENELVIIDQHAAHERIIFEKITKGDDSGLKKPQPFLIPIIGEFSISESEILTKYTAKFEELGFEIANIGKNSFAIHSVPAVLSGKDPRGVLKDIISKIKAASLIEVEESSGKLFVEEEIAKVIACRSAVMAGDILEKSQIEKLIFDLKQCKTTYCPHGRVAVVNFSLEEIEKMFNRR